MTDDTDTAVDIEDVDLNTFEAEFFQTEPVKEEVVEEKAEEVEENVDENEEDDSLAIDDEDDAEDEDEDTDEDSEEKDEPEPEPKAKKRNRTQERIEKLVAEAREAQRERDAFRVELDRVRAEKETVQKEEEKPLREKLSEAAPNPDAKDDDGNAVYELGEFDPKYIRDLTKFTIAEETKAAREVAAREAHEANLEAERTELRTKWETNLAAAEKVNPDIKENIRQLTEVFSDLETNYGEYLATTLMGSDLGPQVMDYLSQNIGEARKIVASGPVAATLALGRLEAKFMNTPIKQEEKRNIKLVSKASEPPEGNPARGRGGKFAVALDTDDLDAFEREFFK
jgi:chemotaxis protein histidine kinase CheA